MAAERSPRTVQRNPAVSEVRLKPCYWSKYLFNWSMLSFIFLRFLKSKWSLEHNPVIKRLNCYCQVPSPVLPCSLLISPSGRGPGPPSSNQAPLLDGVQAAGRQILSQSVQLQVQHQGILAGEKGPGAGVGNNEGPPRHRRGWTGAWSGIKSARCLRTKDGLCVGGAVIWENVIETCIISYKK